MGGTRPSLATRSSGGLGGTGVGGGAVTMPNVAAGASSKSDARLPAAPPTTSAARTFIDEQRAAAIMRTGALPGTSGGPGGIGGGGAGGGGSGAGGPGSSGAAAGPGSSGSAAAPGGGGGTYAVAVYEESVATGAFRRVTAGEGLMSGVWRSGGTRGDGGGGLGGGGADAEAEALPPTTPITPAVARAVAVLASLANGLLVGIGMATVLIVGQFDDGSTAVATLAPFVAPLRFTSYVLSMLAWLGAADALVRYRRAVVMAQGVAAKAAVVAGSGPSGGGSGGVGGAGGAAALAPVPRLTLSAGRQLWLIAAAQTVVAATVLATMPLDNRIRMQVGVPVATLAASTSATSDYSAWRALVIIRFAAVLAAFMAQATITRGPEDVDVVVADREAEWRRTVNVDSSGGGGSGGGGGGDGSVNTGAASLVSLAIAAPTPSPPPTAVPSAAP